MVRPLPARPELRVIASAILRPPLLTRLESTLIEPDIPPLPLEGGADRLDSCLVLRRVADED